MPVQHEVVPEGVGPLAAVQQVLAQVPSWMRSLVVKC